MIILLFVYLFVGVVKENVLLGEIVKVEIVLFEGL